MIGAEDPEERCRELSTVSARIRKFVERVRIVGPDHVEWVLRPGLEDAMDDMLDTYGGGPRGTGRDRGDADPPD